MKDKDGEVTLKNDRSISFENGAEVKKDSLMLFNHVTESIERSIPLKEIEKTNYYSNFILALPVGIIPDSKISSVEASLWRSPKK